MSFLIEMMFLEWAVCRNGLMLTFTIRAFKGIGAEFTLLHFKSGRDDFVVGLITPCEFSVVDGLMQAVTFDTLCLLDSANACSMASFPAIFVLGDTWVHVSTTNSYNESSYIELSVNEEFSFGATLSIPNVNSYDGYVRFWGDLDYSGFRS